jgi:hypothetical protein
MLYMPTNRHTVSSETIGESIEQGVSAQFLNAFKAKNHIPRYPTDFSTSRESITMATESIWTDEYVSRLRELWGQGKTASEIATILGNKFTRNSVIGKVHRLKLSGRPSPIKQRPLELSPPRRWAPPPFWRWATVRANGRWVILCRRTSISAVSQLAPVCPTAPIMRSWPISPSAAKAAAMAAAAWGTNP